MSSYLLDPNATLDFTFDWSGWLATGETIASAEVLAPLGITVAPAGYPTLVGTTAVTAWLTGGTDGVTYTIVCRITTSASRVHEQSLRVRILDRTPRSSAAPPSDAATVSYVPTSSVGVANGVASLDAGGKVPEAQLPPAAVASDATTTAKGIVQLAGDLAGTAAAPTVPGLASMLTTAAAPELIRDTMGTTLVAGANVTITPDDVADTIMIGSSGSAVSDIPATLNPVTATINNVNLGAANRALYLRVAQGSATCTKVGLHVTVSSGNIGLAVYAASGVGVGSRPGTRLATTGAIPCPAAGYAEVTLGVPVLLDPTRFLSISADNTTAAFRNGPNGVEVSNIYLGSSMYQDGAAHPPPETPAVSGGHCGLCPLLIGVS